jgi:hypothetical protein
VAEYVGNGAKGTKPSPELVQIVVFTCRPSDYLAGTSMVPSGSGFHTETENGFMQPRCCEVRSSL